MECGAAACHSSAVDRGSASPQNRLQRRVGKIPGVSRFFLRSSAATDGTENHTVTWCFATNRGDASRSSGCIEHTQAPRAQATNRSKTERSKVWSNVCDSRSAGVMPYRAVT